MKEKIFAYSKDRPFIVNLCIAIFCLIGMIIIPSILALCLIPIVKNDNAATIIADFIFIIVLVLIFLKDLIKEKDTYFKDFKNKFKYSFKIYILGYLTSILCNLFIAVFLKEISSNESQVREMLYNNVIPTLISISIIAPILEELVFRKSLQPLFNNKWPYIIVSGLLFGSAHILVNFIQGTFVITDVIYILPYACLGGSFALMDYDTKTTFSSMIIHSLHNTITAILLLVTYLGPKLGA